MIIRRRELLSGLLVVGLAMAAQAAPSAPANPDLSPADQARVAQAARYLDDLKTAEGRFVQTDTAGRRAAGSFWIQRPGRARFDYDPPSGLVIASDGRLVTVENGRLKTLQNYPLALTPLSIFLARDIRLDRDVMIRAVTASQDGFAITVSERRAPSRGRITLDFSRAPLALTGWALTDSRDQTVTVRLTRLERAPPRPKAFFDIGDPDHPDSMPGAAAPPA